MSFYISDKHNLVFWIPQGELNKGKILKYYEALRDCPIGAQANRYCDFSEVSGFRIDYSILHAMSEFRRKHLHHHKGMKLVMYSDKPIGFGLSRMYQSLMSDWEMTILVSSDRDEAARFLNLPSKEFLLTVKAETNL